MGDLFGWLGCLAAISIPWTMASDRRPVHRPTAAACVLTHLLYGSAAACQGRWWLLASSVNGLVALAYLAWRDRRRRDPPGRDASA